MVIFGSESVLCFKTAKVERPENMNHILLLLGPMFTWGHGRLLARPLYLLLIHTSCSGFSPACEECCHASTPQGGASI